MPETANTWERVLSKVEHKVNPRSFSTWFEPTRYLSDNNADLVVQVPNAWFADWLTTHYFGIIEESLREIQRPGLNVVFHPEFQDLGASPSVQQVPPIRTAIDSTAAAPSSGGHGRGQTAVNPSRGFARTGFRATASTGSAVPANWNEPAGSKLNPKYTFDTFVVSSCNQFAHAASVAVAEQPTKSYNPLYIYGGVGLGKTHLMQAVGNLICRQGNMRMHYISSEMFMNDLINAIRFEQTQEFKERYRNVDVLLIDDIQFLAGKERTQEEFFHTFNALYDAQKQIVITSDVPPRDIPTLEERLRSRFEWGLIADIQPPDLETKVAILRKKAEHDGTFVSDDVTLFIASHCGTNIRELEGALTKIVAYSSMSGRDVNVELAKEQLRDFMPIDSPATTVENIQKLVANYYDLRVADLKAKNNRPQVAQPRQLAMYLSKKLTVCSLPDIGRRFGGKHHSTVLHAINKVEQRRIKEKEFDNLVASLSQSLGA